MSELEDLKAKKREIEARIRELNNQTVTVGTAKLDKEHYPTDKPDEWGIYIFRQFDDDLDRKKAWRSIIRSRDRNACVDKLEIVIADLQGLLGKLREDGK